MYREDKPALSGKARKRQRRKISRWDALNGETNFQRKYHRTALVQVAFRDEIIPEEARQTGREKDTR